MPFLKYNLLIYPISLFTVAPICPKLPSPANGKVTVSGQGSNVLATYQCNRGFSLVGTRSRSCRNGVWLGTAPVCRGKAFLTMYCLLSFQLFACSMNVC